MKTLFNIFFIGLLMVPAGILNAMEYEGKIPGKGDQEEADRPAKKQKTDTDEVKEVKASTALIEAIKTGNVELVKKLLSEITDFDAIDSSGYTYLHYAATLQTPDILILILQAAKKAGSDIVQLVNIKHAATKASPLELAIVTDRTENVKFLLMFGADSKTASRANKTPGQWAILKDNDRTVHILLQHDPDILNIHIELSHSINNLIQLTEKELDNIDLTVTMYVNIGKALIKPNKKMLQTFILSYPGLFFINRDLEHGWYPDRIQIKIIQSLLEDAYENEEINTGLHYPLMEMTAFGADLALKDFFKHNNLTPEAVVATNNHRQTAFDVLATRFALDGITPNQGARMDEIAKFLGEKLGFIMSLIRRHGFIEYHSVTQEGATSTFVPLDTIPSEIWFNILRYIVGSTRLYLTLYTDHYRHQS